MTTLAYKATRCLLIRSSLCCLLFTFNRVMSSKMQLTVRPSNERGHADHGWLNSYHTWSFASYHDPRFTNGFGCLRVLNEDRVQPTTGFGTHPHREYEIFSYVIDGELEHKDSLGNTETIHRGEVQFTSTGTGIEHSEYNVHKSLWVHFIQIWVKPNQSRLKPSYSTKNWSDAEKMNRLCLLIEDIGEHRTDAIGIHAPLSMYASILQANQSIEHRLKRSKGYIHLVMRSGAGETCSVNAAKIRLNGDRVLQEGDGAFIQSDPSNSQLTIENIGSTNAEFLLFDLD
jgi:quercetin 2,3-dioxygenase